MSVLTDKSSVDYHYYWRQALEHKVKELKGGNAMGLAIIAVNCKVPPKLRNELTELPTTAYAAGKEVEKTFNFLHFTTVYCEEVSQEELKAIFKQAARLNYHETSIAKPVIVLYLIGHGRLLQTKGPEGKHTFCTKTGEVLITDDIVLQFRPQLDLKLPSDSGQVTTIPKLFFFDCCWGTETDQGIVVAQKDVEATDSVRELVQYTIRPRAGNLLIAHAVMPSYKAFCLPELKEHPTFPKGPLWTWFLLRELQKDQSIYDALQHATAGLMAQYDEWWKDRALRVLIWGSGDMDKARAIQQPVFTSTMYGDKVLNLYRRAGYPPAKPCPYCSS